ncbi:MAG: transketolase [Pseudohongiellaceae bacterium]
MLDRNGIQIDGFTKDVMDQGDLAAKYAAFGWHVTTIDGHDMDALNGAIDEAKTIRGKPQLICCETVLGKGVSFMENVPTWHGVTPDADQANAAMAELGLS